MVNKEIIPLCFRCEHQAEYLSSKGQHCPRLECGDVNIGVHSCYMFMPVKPVILEPDKGDKRPRMAGWGISAREHAIGLANFVLKVIRIRNKKLIIYWSKNG
ncbi:MAG: hypothetical protein WC451_05335 [Patescibacteria group bacterium]